MPALTMNSRRSWARANNCRHPQGRTGGAVLLCDDVRHAKQLRGFIGYESQIVEFIVANPNSRKLIQDTVCVLYPEPTVWSSHPIVSLNDRGDRLIEAMMDEEVQRLAWNEHGFRSGLAEIRVDKHAVQLDCIAEEIQVVTPLPGKKTFKRILDALEEL